ncbi:MAG: DNA topoisomerase IV [Flavobacteriaceae bacterium]|nr:DNA topoisomerase IV [Flavobacteriaceae bacterium]
MWRLVFFILVLFISCYSLERDCKPFQQGEFKFTQIINGEIKSSYFTRDSIFEVELFEGKIDTSSIRWVNDCECILTKLSPNNNQEKRPIQIRIISTKVDRYTFEYSLVGDSKNRQRGSIQKIN